ncbi:MAG: glycosyltransferase [Acidimicrobiales bacterium]|nr:glycosyltransferase [Acidimicrobiia bacterium]NNC81809.1 glycosyltransferase [Acidimicrobiales bacterium]RZV45459.1 MAG: glycosyltransferase [Acidimicrobiales bacterium]
MVSAPASPTVSVIIPVFNNADHLVQQLDGINAGLAAAPATELIVVDNRSTDGSAEVAQRWAADHPDVNLRVVPASDRPGEPYARNVGLDTALGDHILYCDGDDIVGPRWLPAMAAALDEHAYVTGPIDMYELNETWIADVRGSSVTSESLLFDLVPYAHGCSMGFRRELLEDLGGFDEDYPAGCDLDIAIRAWRGDVILHFVPDAVVHYRLRPSLRATFDQGRAYGRYRIPVRNQLEDAIDVSAARRANLRRVGWLVVHGPRALVSQPTRARWVWVASQILGEIQGEFEARRR